MKNGGNFEGRKINGFFFEYKNITVLNKINKIINKKFLHIFYLFRIAYHFVFSSFMLWHKLIWSRLTWWSIIWGWCSYKERNENKPKNLVAIFNRKSEQQFEKKRNFTSSLLHYQYHHHVCDYVYILYMCLCVMRFGPTTIIC